MKIVLKNIGVLKEAEIVLDGMSVITGYNDSGKSTIGKALYSLYHGVNFYQQSIVRDSIDYLMKPFFNNKDEMDFDGSIMQIHWALLEYLGQGKPAIVLEMHGREKLMDKIRKIYTKSGKEIPADKESKEEILKDFEERLEKIGHEQFRLQVKRNVVSRTFRSEFGGQVENVYTKEPGSISFYAGAPQLAEFHVGFNKEEIQGVENEFPKEFVFSDVILIDTPMILNYLRVFGSPFLRVRMEDDHKSALLSKLATPKDAKNKGNIVETSLLDERKKNIIEKMHSILKGNIEIDEEQAVYCINEQKFELSTLAGGLKTYVIIRRLIDNGYLGDGSLLVIDEPEVHLHPAWQLDFAELLVIMQKELGIKMILTTHSPYFLQALDVFSRKYRISNDTHFYLAERSEHSAVLRNIDGKIDETYNLLAEPILRLRDIMDEEIGGES